MLTCDDEQIPVTVDYRKINQLLIFCKHMNVKGDQEKVDWGLSKIDEIFDRELTKGDHEDETAIC